MNRALFYNKVVIDSIAELDILYNNLGEFAIKYPVNYYRVSSDDILRPDLISSKLYKTPNYWWIILLVNGIQDSFTELYSGQLLIIPNILDIYEFNRDYKI
jgi:hypothetical protein